MRHRDLHITKNGAIYTADWGAGPRRCSVGRNGIGIKNAEGDGVTPAGTWALRRVLFRSDRIAGLRSALPTAAILPNDGWCDAPGDAEYNRLVTLPFRSSAEPLWRGDGLYDVVVVVGFNDTPVIPGKGSAIFLHVARDDFAATEGCVALARDDLLEAIAGFTPDARISIES